MLQNKKEAACINMLSTFFFWSNMLSTLIDTKQLLLLELTFKPNSSLKLREIAFRAHKLAHLASPTNIVSSAYCIIIHPKTKENCDQKKKPKKMPLCTLENKTIKTNLLTSTQILK